VPAGAVLRQLPALLEEHDDLPNGTLEAVVGDGEESAIHLFEIIDGRLHANSEAGGKASVRLEGDDDAWIAALGPRRDYSGLSLSGKQRMAQRILDSLPRGDGHVEDGVLDGLGAGPDGDGASAGSKPGNGRAVSDGRTPGRDGAKRRRARAAS
jgi:hypothetical protein